MSRRVVIKTTANGDLVYPLPLDARLGTFDRMDFFHRRWRHWETLAHAISEGKERAAFYALQLWFGALDETPVGTIPEDEGRQMQLVGLGGDRRRWRGVAHDALAKFVPIVDHEGRRIPGRLAHPMTLEVALEAHRRQQANEERKRKKSVSERRGRFRKVWKACGYNPEAVATAPLVDAHLAYLECHDLVVNEAHVRKAKEAVLRGWQPPARAEVIPIWKPQ